MWGLGKGRLGGGRVGVAHQGGVGDLLTAGGEVTAGGQGVGGVFWADADAAF